MKWSLIFWLAGGALANTALAADGPLLFYSKSFPGSVPPYVEITLAKNGDVAYREAPDEDNPIKFQLKDAETEEVFGLVEKAGSLKHNLEAPAKVAFMGTKTFRYLNGSEKNEVKFNYTQDAAAQALQDWFERMAESAQRLIDLERTAKYDKLGVVKSLLLLQTSLEHKRLLGPEQFFPSLAATRKKKTTSTTRRPPPP